LYLYGDFAPQVIILAFSSWNGSYDTAEKRNKSVLDLDTDLFDSDLKIHVEMKALWRRIGS